MTEHHENEANDRPELSAAGELERLRRRVAELERREAGYRQTEKALTQEQERFRLFYEQSPLGYQSLDAEGRILEVNPTWLETLGYERDHVVGRWFGDFLTPEFRRGFADRFARFKEIGEINSLQFDMLCGDGRSICVEFDGRISRTAEGDFDRTHCVMRDVTERKRNEESLRASEERVRRLLENLPDGVFIHDLQGRIVMVNRAACENTGYSRDELLAMGVGGIDTQENVEQEWSRFWAALDDDRTVCLEREHKRKDGTVYPAELYLNRLELQGQSVIVGIARDITDRVHAVEEVHAGRQKLATIFDSAPVMMIVVNADRRVCNANRAALEATGYSAEEIEGLRGGAAMRCLHALDDPQGCGFGPLCEECTIRQAVVETLERGVSHRHVEARLSVMAGEQTDERIFQVSTARVDTPTEPLVLICLEDFTEQKKAEEKLRESEQRYREMFENTSNAIFQLDVTAEGQFRFTDWNPVEERTLGIAAADVCGKQPADFLPGDIAEALTANYRRCFDAGEPISYEEALDLPGGRLYSHTTLVPIRDAEGRICRILGIGRDITEQKEATWALQQSEQKFRAIADYTYDLELWAGSDGRLIWMNLAVERFTGYTAEECQAMPDFPARLIHQQDRAHVLALYRQACEGGSGNDVQFRVVHRNGTFTWVSASWQPLPGQDGADLGWRCSIRDIDDRVRIEETLRDSEELFRTVFEQAAVGIAQVTAEGRFEHVNSRLCDILGYSRDELHEMTFRDVTHPEDLKLEEADIARVLAGEIDSFEIEKRYFRKDGRLVWVKLFSNVVRDEQGRVRYAIASVVDITALKESEEALIDSSRRLGETIRAGNVGLWDWDLATNQVRYSAEWKRQIGYEEDEIGDRLEEWEIRVHPDDLAPALARIQQAIADASAHYQVEFRFRHKNGAYRWILTQASVFCDEAGRPNRVLGSHIDITERKRFEQILQESEQTYRTLVQSLPDIVLRFDREGRHLFASDNVERVTGLPASRFFGRTHRELGFPEDQCRFWEEAVRRIWDTGAPFETEFTFESPEGMIVFNWRLTPEFDTRGVIQSVLSISRDITEHRRLERDYQILFREMLNGFALHEIICDAQGQPVDYRFLAVNPVFERVTGLKAQDIVGRTVREVLPDTEPRWIETYGRVAQTGEPTHFEDHHEGLGKHFEVTAFRPALGQFACIFTDITERKRAEETLACHRAELQAIYDHAPVMMCVLGSDRRVLYANRAFTEFTGVAEDELRAGRACGVFGCINAQTDPRGCGFGRDCERCAVRLAIEDTLRTGVSHRDIEYRATLEHHGVPREIVLLAATARVEANGRSNLLLCLQDITERQKSEDRLRLLGLVLEQIQDRVTMTDLQGNITFVNDAECRARERSREEIVGGHASIYEGNLVQGTTPQRVIEATLTQGQWRGEMVNRTSDGTEVITDLRTILVRDAQGAPIGLCGIGTDITERRRAERALRESEERFRAVFEQAPDAIVLIDCATARFVEFNQHAHETLGYSREEFSELTVADIDACESREQTLAHTTEVVRCGEDHFSTQHRTRDGRLLDIQVSARPLSLHDRNLLVGIWTDITDRRRAEKQVQQTTKLLAAIKDAQNLYIAGADAREVYQTLLQTLVTITDSEYGFLDEVLRDESGQLYKRSLAISDISWDEQSRRLYQQHLQRGLEFYDLSNLAGLPALTGKLVISNAPEQDPRSGGIPKGHPPLRTFMGVPMYFGGQITGVAGVANGLGCYDEETAEFLKPFVATCASIIHAFQNDAKEQQHREALQENHANLLAILEATDDLIASRDCAGRLVFCNPAFARMVRRLFGVEAAPGLRTLDYLPAAKREHWERVLAQVTAGEPYRGEFEWDLGDQDLRFYEISFHPIRKGEEIIGTVEYNRDITEQRRLQRQAEQRQAELLHVSRLSTLGEMASGIAHELNQPLTAILCYGEACRRRVQGQAPDLPSIAEYLGQIISQGERAGLIIRRMRALAKRLRSQFAVVDLTEVIQNSVGMSQWELKQNEIQLIREIAESLPLVYADAIQIEQVLLNLIRNSMDAMRCAKDGPQRLTIRAMALDDKHVRVEVCDSGIGLPPGTEDRVFDPFFTNKPDGLGIGLSISRSFIESHGGTIEAKANPDRGATFFFTLPVSQTANQRESS